MNAKRYFQVTDKTILAGVKAHQEKISAMHKTLDAWANKHGFERAAITRYGLWDRSFEGCICTYHEHQRREDKQDWCRPQNNCTHPKVASKTLSAEYKALYKKTRIGGADMDELTGVRHINFIFDGMGMNYFPDKDLLIFTMPARVDSVKGAKEITNVEFIALTEEKAVAA